MPSDFDTTHMEYTVALWKKKILCEITSYKRIKEIRLCFTNPVPIVRNEFTSGSLSV